MAHWTDETPSVMQLELLREVATSGVEFEDERVSYVTVQIDRATWFEIKTFVESTTAL